MAGIHPMTCLRARARRDDPRAASGRAVLSRRSETPVGHREGNVVAWSPLQLREGRDPRRPRELHDPGAGGGDPARPAPDAPGHRGRNPGPGVPGGLYFVDLSVIAGSSRATSSKQPCAPSSAPTADTTRSSTICWRSALGAAQQRPRRTRCSRTTSRHSAACWRRRGAARGGSSQRRGGWWRLSCVGISQV